jgi:uncharacterized membrane protein YfcA
VLSLWAALGGLAVGLALGLLGGGGSTLTVPLLLALGVEAKPAVALSLAVVATTAAAALVSHARAGRIDARAATWLLPAVTLGGFAGGRAAALFSGRALITGFALLMAAAGISMLTRRPTAEPPPAARPGALGAAGLAVGAVTGMVGVGGGFLFVPILTLFGGLGMRRAVGTSLLAITFNAGAALVGQLGHVRVPLDLALPLCGAGVLGAVAGARLSGRVPERVLRRSFGALVLGIAVWLAARAP